MWMKKGIDIFCFQKINGCQAIHSHAQRVKDKPKETPAFPNTMKIGGFAVSKLIPK